MNEGDLKAGALASDKKTSNLPTFKDIGKALGGLGGSAPGADLLTLDAARRMQPSELCVSP